MFCVSIYTMLKSLKRKTTRSFTVRVQDDAHLLTNCTVQILRYSYWRDVTFIWLLVISSTSKSTDIRYVVWSWYIKSSWYIIKSSCQHLLSGKISRPSFDTSSIVFCRLILYVEAVLCLLEHNFCWEERKSVTGRSLSNFSNFNDRFVIHYVVKSENINNSPPRVRVKRAHLIWIGSSNSSIHIFLSTTK